MFVCPSPALRHAWLEKTCVTNEPSPLHLSHIRYALGGSRSGFVSSDGGGFANTRSPPFGCLRPVDEVAFYEGIGGITESAFSFRRQLFQLLARHLVHVFPEL